MMKKYWMAALFLWLLFLGGCAKADTDAIVDKAVVDTTYKIYYISSDKVSLVGVPNTYMANTAQGLMEESILGLQIQPAEEGYVAAIPEAVTVEKCSYDAGAKQVDIYFNAAYKNIPKNEEILVRAAIVKTLTQFDSIIDYVQFFVAGEALTESDGRPMIMMKSDFVENTKADTRHLNQQLIRLYFAGSDGTGLVAEDVSVHFYKSTTLENIIVESLISGPIAQTLNPTLSSDVKLNNNVTVDAHGICYVDFNKRFLDQTDAQAFLLSVYSVVNSLTELAHIQGVQLLIDGNVVAAEDSSVPLDEPLKRDETLIVKTGETPPVVESMAPETQEVSEIPAESETKTEQTKE